MIMCKLHYGLIIFLIMFSFFFLYLKFMRIFCGIYASKSLYKKSYALHGKFKFKSVLKNMIVLIYWVEFTILYVIPYNWQYVTYVQ